MTVGRVPFMPESLKKPHGSVQMAGATLGRRCLAFFAPEVRIIRSSGDMESSESRNCWSVMDGSNGSIPAAVGDTTLAEHYVDLCY